MSILSATKKIFGGQEEPKDEPEKKPQAESSDKAKPKAPRQTKKKITKVGSVERAGAIGLRLIVTEKSMDEQGRNVAVFRVNPQATKGQILLAVREKYQVKPLKIRTMNYRPKIRRRGQTQGMTRYWKKAYVWVEDLKSINIAP